MSKLLIVDDEVDIREFAKSFFVKRDIEVLTASGGIEAIKIIKEENRFTGDERIHFDLGFQFAGPENQRTEGNADDRANEN